MSGGIAVKCTLLDASVFVSSDGKNVAPNYGRERYFPTHAHLLHRDLIFSLSQPSQKAVQKPLRCL